MTGAFLYRWVLVSENPAESIRVLNDVALCRLAGWLGREYEENEKTGEVLGLCLVEQAARFAKRVEGSQGQDVPATLKTGEEEG